jgi:uncharacterized repeat protein (TIGR03943 family)
MKRLRDSLLLALWGGFVLWLSATSQLSTYLHPSLQPYTTVAGVTLLVLAAFAVRSLMVAPRAHQECCRGHHDHGDHPHAGHNGHDADHHHGEDESGWLALLFKTLLLLAPLLMILFGQGTKFTMTTVQNRGVVEDLQKLPSANTSAAAAASAASSAVAATSAHRDVSSGAMPVQIIDMLYAVQMPSYREEFEGKEVVLTGQYVPLTTGNPKGDRFQAIRMFITCCAADAKPVGVTIRYPRDKMSLKVPEMGWIKITGKPVFPMDGGRRTAIIEATKVEECTAPSEPFVY